MYAYIQYKRLRRTLVLLVLSIYFASRAEWLTEARPDHFRQRFNLPSICLQAPPHSESVCTIEIEGFFYDPRTNDCEQYVVGGCRTIPGQSFGSRQDCLATCVQGTRQIQDLHPAE